MKTEQDQSIKNLHDVSVVIDEITGYFTIYESRGTDDYNDDILRAAGLLKGENAEDLAYYIKEFKKAIREGGPVEHLWEEFGLVDKDVSRMQSTTDNSSEHLHSVNRNRSETVSSKNNRTENLENNRSSSLEMPSNQSRGIRENSEHEKNSDENINWEIAAQAAAYSVAIMGVIGLAGIFAASIVSVPVLAGLAVLWSAGMAANTCLERANKAMAAGEDDYMDRALVAGVSDLVPVVDIVQISEVITGHDYMTGQKMTQQERSNKAGTLVASSLPLSKGLGKPNRQKRKSDIRLTKEEQNVINHLKDNLMGKMGIALDIARHEPGMISNKASAASNALHFYAQRSLKNNFGNRIKVSKKEPRLVSIRGQKADLEVKIKSTGKEMIIELKATAWVDKNGRLQTPFKNLKQTAALQISAKKNPDKLHIVVTPRGNFAYNIKSRKWEEL